MTTAAATSKTKQKPKQTNGAPTKPPMKAKPAASSADAAQSVQSTAAAPTGCTHALGSVWIEQRSLIRRSATNPRTEFPLDDLISTMRPPPDGKGQLSPVLVRYRPDAETGTLYEIVDGERRDRAAEVIQWSNLEVKLVEMTDEEVEEVQLVTFFARKDLTPVDEAHGIARLDARGYSAQQIAERVSRSVAEVRRALAIARLADEVKQQIRGGALTATSALELAVLTDTDEQRRVLAKALEQRAGSEPVSARTVRFAVEQAMMQLSKAKFDPCDATLLPAAGSCFECPKRSSQQSLLIALPGVQSEGERCTDRACYSRKQEAHWTRAASEAEALGYRVIDGDAARKIVAFGAVAKDSQYVDLDAHCAEIRDGRTWRDHLGARVPQVSVVRGDGGVAHQVVAKQDAVRVLRELGALRPQQQAAQANAPARTAGAAPTSSATPAASESAMLSTQQIVQRIRRERLDSGLLTALVDAVVLVADPSEVETRAIAKPYDVPVPANVEGRDVVIDVARGLQTDADRLVLLARVICATSPLAQAALSRYFARAGEQTGVSALVPSARVLAAVRRGIHKPGEIRAAADVTQGQWQKLVDELIAKGSICAVGEGRAREYHAVEDAAELPANDTAASDDAATDPDVTSDGEPDIAPSEADPEIAGTICDILRTEPMQRALLAEQAAELAGIMTGDADREIETLLREGTLMDTGEAIELVAMRQALQSVPSPPAASASEHRDLF
jgi:ParB/RepB/Spo0J family partition protein